MYIGPWQEYNLSKNKQPANKNTSNIRKELEETLLKNLDENSAQAAIQAVSSFFQNENITNKLSLNAKLSILEKSKIPSLPQKKSQYRPNIRKTRLVTSQKLPPIVYDPNHSPQPNLNQPLKTLSISARGDSKSTPLSVRSTQSEPTKLPSLYSSNSSTHKPPEFPSRPLTGQSEMSSVSANSQFLGNSQNKSTYDQNIPPLQPQAYDNNAMVKFLRMERNNKAKSEIMKMTGWKNSNSDNQKSTNFENSDSCLQDQKRDIKKELKIEQVNHMKELYISHINKVNSPKEPLKNSFEHSGIAFDDRLESPNIISPRVKEIELTDNELSKVSKYFKAFDEIKSNPQSVINYNLNSDCFPDELPPIDNKEDGPIEELYPDFQITPSSPFRPQNTITPYNDELHLGNGFDGLLKWSTSLEYDDW